MSPKTPGRGIQQGAQSHAEGEHGAKTRDFIRRQQITSRVRDESEKGPTHDPHQIAAHDDVGKDRLFEDREQHDEAEKNSEKTRLQRDVDRHNHRQADELLAENRSASELLRMNRQLRARGME